MNMISIDFYRRLTRIKGLPFWCHRQKSGLHELFSHICLTLSRDQYIDWTEFANIHQRSMVIHGAVRLLREMHDTLTSRGFIHLIYITPSRNQVLGSEARNQEIAEEIRKSRLPVDYILDRMIKLDQSTDDKKSLFVDHIHLSPPGHALWGQIIGKDLLKISINEKS